MARKMVRTDEDEPSREPDRQNRYLSAWHWRSRDQFLSPRVQAVIKRRTVEVGATIRNGVALPVGPTVGKAILHRICAPGPVFDLTKEISA